MRLMLDSVNATSQYFNMQARSPRNRVGTVIQAVGRSLDRVDAAPLYSQIAGEIQQAILRGSLRPGDVIPSQRQLGEAWGVGEVTVRRALQKLGDRGLLEARPRTGTMVLDPRSQRIEPASARSTDPTFSPRRIGRGAADEGLLIGIAFADLADGYPFFSPLLAGMRADQSDVAIRLFDMPAGEQSAGSLVRAPSPDDLDGLVMMSPINLALLARAQQAACPTVLLFSDLSDGFSHCVMPDYASGVTDAVAHLARTGRRRVALVTAGPERFSTGRWIEAFIAALRAQALEVDRDRIVQAGYNERDGAAATRSLLSHTKPPDAILFASDFPARGGLVAAIEAGVSVPQDLAIVGAGPTLDDGGWPVLLACIDLQLQEMGRITRRVIAAARDGRGGTASRHAVSSQFRSGATA